MSRDGARRGPLAALLALAALVAPLPLAVPPAHATLEEYSTFDVVRREQDIKSLFDHLLSRTPREWRDEWERAPQGVRTGQGCLTSEDWLVMTEFKATAPMGDRARLDVHLLQDHSDAADYEVLGFAFRFPVRWGAATAEFQPSSDKSRQDFVFGWELGADTTRFHVQAALNVEDMFNNLWAWRQSRVGGVAEPYLRRPYEPRLVLGARGEDWRAELGGRWMRPSLKQVADSDPTALPHDQSLWGAIAWASLEKRALGVDWEVATRDQQVRTTDVAPAAPLVDHADFRREWSAELVARRALSRRLGGLLRGIYQDRTEDLGAGLGPGAFRALDRLSQAELTVRLHPRLTGRVGLMHDSITIAEDGTVPRFTWGTRAKSRAYLGLMARVGRVWLQGVEGLELSHEPYKVWGVHDKGFLHLQTTF